MSSITVEALEKRFGSFVAVDGISFDVREGEIFGFLGPNGAGKSTTVNMLTCQLRPTGGTAHVKGIPLTDERGIRSIIGIVPQELALNDLLTAYQNLVLYGSLYGVSRVDAKRRALEMLEAMGLEKRKNDLVKDFSGGMKQRLNVVMALMHEPKVLFLDEPTTGMDPQARRMIWDFIRDINKRGTTIFLTTHYMEEADYLCNRVAIIDEGRIKAIDTPRALKRQIKGEDIIQIQVDEDERLLDDVKGIPNVKDALYANGMLKLFIEDRDGLLLDIATVLSGRSIVSISSAEPTLEDVFLSLTGKKLRD